MDREDLVSVCTVTSPTEAEIIRGVLQSAGIACEIGGEGQAGLAGVLSIDVLTHLDDAEAARKHLKQLKSNIRLRRKRRAEARKAREAALSQASPPAPSDSIQEMNPRGEFENRPPEMSNE
jgi:hypothetical protein